MYTACAHVRHTWAQMQQKCVPMYVYLYNTIQGQFVASTAPSEVAPNWTPDPCNTSCTGWSAAEPYEGRVSLSIHTDQTLGHIMYIHGHMIHIHGLSTPAYMGTQYLRGHTNFDWGPTALRICSAFQGGGWVLGKSAWRALETDIHIVDHSQW